MVFGRMHVMTFVPLVTFEFMDEEANANTDDEENFMILTALLKLQEEENITLKHGGSKCVRNKLKPSQ
jgi:hypothetical protein